MRRLVSNSVPFRGSPIRIRACVCTVFYATTLYMGTRSAWARVGTLVFAGIEVGRHTGPNMDVLSRHSYRTFQTALRDAVQHGRKAISLVFSKPSNILPVCYDTRSRNALALRNETSRSFTWRVIVARERKNCAIDIKLIETP